MGKELVEVKNKKVYCDSLIFAEKLSLNHRDVLRDIRNLTATNSAVKNEFIETFWTNLRNRTYPKINMTKKGFMSLIMNTGITPDKKTLLYDVQNEFINAFEKMEQLLLKEAVNRSNLEWERSREQGKAIRLEMTDTVKKFVEYATNQGSTNANRYYSNITKMEYKALGLMQQANPKLRDTLDLMELTQLLLSEDLVKRQLEKYMQEGLHYKEIYIFVKQDVENFSKCLLLTKE